MKKLLDIYKAVRIVSESRVGVFGLIPQRGIKFQESIKWVKPEKKRFYDPACSGDLVPMPKINPDIPYSLFKYSKELQTADEKIKKIFSVGHQLPRHVLRTYERQLIKKVQNNPYDNNSLEVQIARCTARIRFLQSYVMKKPAKHSSKKIKLISSILHRRFFLRKLRRRDYKKFEWILETLDLEYKPPPYRPTKVTRKKSLLLLAKLKVEQIKEEKIAAIKKSYDEQKVPFLEKKIIKLKEIKEKEKKYNLHKTVKEKDIEECIKKLEKVKVEVAERAERGYVRKIHPYFLEPYDKTLLWEKERTGEKIREEICKAIKAQNTN